MYFLSLFVLFPFTSLHHPFIVSSASISLWISHSVLSSALLANLCFVVEAALRVMFGSKGPMLLAMLAFVLRKLTRLAASEVTAAAATTGRLFLLLFLGTLAAGSIISGKSTLLDIIIEMLKRCRRFIEDLNRI